MSWDVFIQDLPKNVVEISDIPSDFRPKTIGKRDDIISEIQTVCPGCDFTDKSWGILDGDGFSIEFNMGSEIEIDGFTCHIRGTSLEAIETIEKILNKLELKGIDANQGELFKKEDAIKSFKEWQDYRDSVADNPRYCQMLWMKISEKAYLRVIPKPQPSLLALHL